MISRPLSCGLWVRSYMAFALTQELPIVDWLNEIDRIGSSAVVQTWPNRMPQ